MIYLEIPLIKEAAKAYDKIKLQSYRIYSSLFEPTPKANFKYASDYVMPDLLGIRVGSSFPVQYTVNIDSKKKSESEEDKTSDEEQKHFTDPVNLAGVCVQSIEPEGGANGGLLTTVTCTGEYDFFQNARIRKAYTQKYGNEIVKDVLDSNRIMKTYKRNIQKTDNYNTVYRSLGEADISFVTEDVAKQFVINAGQPLFFTSLDRKIHFTSLNNLLENTKKSKVVIDLGSTYDEISRKFVKKQLKNYTDRKKSVTLSAVKYKFHIGGKESTFSIKNSLYFTDFENNSTTTSVITYKPALKNKAYFPLDAFFMETAESTQAAATYNRPTSTIAFEAKNYFRSFEDLITVDIEIANIQNLKELILAGDNVTVITAYPYSVYNGNYIVSAVEYGLENNTNFMKLQLLRPTVDMTWAEGLVSDKSSQDFKYPYAPSINKFLYYNI